MAPTMTTRNAGRRTATTRGGRTVDRLLEEVEELKSKRAELVDKLVIKVAEELTEVMERVEVLMKSLTLLPSSLNNCKTYFLLSSPKNVNVGNGRNGCSYKDFVECKIKEFNGKGGAKVKYFAGSLTGRALTWWNSEVRTRVREAESSGITPWLELIIQRTLTDSMSLLVAATEPPTIQSAILKAGVLTDKADRNGSLNRYSGESSKERNVKGDNMRARTGKTFATITNPIRKEYTGLAHTCTN
ncbi:hypothetical protein Tco_1380415 [Tanacetum coccineum]